MAEQGEVLVLNYPVEDAEMLIDATVESEVGKKLDVSFDENQNARVTVKNKLSKVSSNKAKAKALMVMLEKKELRPKKLHIQDRVYNNGNSLSSVHSLTLKRKRGRPPKQNKNVEVSGNNKNKVNGFKSPILKNLTNRDLVQKPSDQLEANHLKNAINIDRNNSVVNEVIKVENNEASIFATPGDNINLDIFRESDDIALKYESLEQIHTEFKYESLSETEENIRRKKQAIFLDSKENTSRSTQKLQGIKRQTTLDTFFKVVDVQLKCQLPKFNIFKCEHCLYVGNSKANLERHSLIHMNPNDILWYRCTDCEYKSKYEHQLKSHTLIHKNPNEIPYFQCPHCDLKCSRKHNLTNHIKSIHSDRINAYKCAECDYSTFSKDRLVAHVKKHSREVFTCTLCKFVTKRKEYLENHFKLKHTEVNKPFPCDTCSYKGKTKRELDRHYDRMHNKEKLHEYKCNNCDFSSIYKKNLEFHLLHMHQKSEGFQKFICGHCLKEFAYKNGLKTHIIRIHLKLTEEDWHKCQECRYKCKDVNTLKRHIRRNHGAPRLHCKQCSFATNRQKSMSAHMKTHEADSDIILKCPECPYRIIQAVSFVYHMKVLHGKPIGTKDIHRYYLKED